MSSDTTKPGSIEIIDFVLGIVDGKVLRFKAVELVPTGTTPITLQSVNEMSKEDLGKLYTQVAGVSPKSFKDKKVAVESLIYQVSKLTPIDDAVSQAQAAAPRPPQQGAPPATSTPKTRRSDTFELLTPVEAPKLIQALPPQAKDLLAIMAQLAREKQSTKIQGGDLVDRLNSPEAKEILHTRQDPTRILQYYKGKLIGAGLIRVS